MASIIGIVPPELIDPKKKDEFLLWLQTFPIPHRRKKEILTDWAAYTGIVLTWEDFERLLGSSEHFRVQF